MPGSGRWLDQSTEVAVTFSGCKERIHIMNRYSPMFVTVTRYFFLFLDIDLICRQQVASIVVDLGTREL